MKTRFPASVPFDFRFIQVDSTLPALGRGIVARLEGNLHTVGAGNFRYAFEPYAQPDPFGTAWLMRFYDLHTFFCVTASN
jgi:hypothetical protein